MFPPEKSYDLHFKFTLTLSWHQLWFVNSQVKVLPVKRWDPDNFTFLFKVKKLFLLIHEKMKPSLRFSHEEWIKSTIQVSFKVSPQN